LLGMAIPFLLGTLLPVAIFLLPYIRAHALSSWYNGVFVLPLKRVADAGYPPLDWVEVAPAAGIAFLVGLGIVAYRRRDQLMVALSATLFYVVLIAFSFQHILIYEAAWHSIQGATPLLVGAGVLRLAGLPRNKPGVAGLLEQHLFLLLSVTALCSLVQFPFAFPAYFCYFAPLAILAGAALLSTFPGAPKLLLASTALFYAIFAVVLFTPGSEHNMGWHYAREFDRTPMALPIAAGLRFDSGSARLYDQLIPFVQLHAAGGGILAAPDCPQVYVLAGFLDPTRSPFQFFEDLSGYKGRIQQLIRSEPIRVVVIRNPPTNSSAYAQPLREAVDGAFPYWQQIGMFEVRWRQ
jgi:hypothetical protein